MVNSGWFGEDLERHEFLESLFFFIPLADVVLLWISMRRASYVFR